MCKTKDWSDTPESDGAPVEGGRGAAMKKKRKMDSLMFGSNQQPRSEKFGRLTVEETLNSEKETNYVLRAKSWDGGGMTERLNLEEAIGLDLKSLTKMEGKCFLGIGQDELEKHINSQIYN